MVDIYYLKEHFVSELKMLTQRECLSPFVIYFEQLAVVDLYLVILGLIWGKNEILIIVYRHYILDPVIFSEISW